MAPRNKSGDDRQGKVSNLPHPEILASVEAGHQLLLDDGKIRLAATAIEQGRIVTRVEVGGKLSARTDVARPTASRATKILRTSLVLHAHVRDRPGGHRREGVGGIVDIGVGQRAGRAERC